MEHNIQTYKSPREKSKRGTKDPLCVPPPGSHLGRNCCLPCPSAAARNRKYNSVVRGAFQLFSIPTSCVSPLSLLVPVIKKGGEPGNSLSDQ